MPAATDADVVEVAGLFEAVPESTGVPHCFASACVTEQEPA